MPASFSECAHVRAFSSYGNYDARSRALAGLPARQQVLLAADWAELALPIWEEAYPGDDRPRRAVEAARDGGPAVNVAAARGANVAAARAARDVSVAASVAASAAANAANAAACGGVYFAAYAAYDAAYAADWAGVRRLWVAAHNAGADWQPEWTTPLARELARDPAAYQILLDHLEEQGAPVEELRAARWARSNWAIYRLLEDKP